MKICHFSSAHTDRDTRIVLKQCRTLAANGYDVSLVVPSSRGRHQFDGIDIYPLRRYTRGKRMVVGAFRAFRKALGVRAKVYHFHDPELLPYGLLLKIMGKKVIYDVHEDLAKDILDKEWINPWIRKPASKIFCLFERFCSRFFDAIVTATPSIRQGFRQDKSICVENFPIMDELSFGEAVSYESRPKQFVYVGGLSAIRCAREMVQALEKVADGEVSLRIAGPFNSEELEVEVARSLGWAQVNYTKWADRREVARLLASARAGLVLFYPVANHVEARPNKLFEYMAAGLPVIASNFPAWRDIVERECCGLMVDPLSTDAIAGAMKWILENPDAASRMGESGRAAVRSKYNWESESFKLLEVYRTVLTSKEN